MSENIIRNDLEKGFQAFISVLYSSTIMLIGTGILLSEFVRIYDLKSMLDPSYSYAIWGIYVLVMAALFSMVLLGISAGFERYGYAIRFFGAALILSGLYELGIVGISYIVGYDIMQFTLLTITGLLKVGAGTLAVIVSKDMSEENFTKMLTVAGLVLLVLILKALDPVFSLMNSGENVDVFRMIFIMMYSLFAEPVKDPILIGLGGILSPFAIVAGLIGLVVAKKRGLSASFGAKLSFASASLAVALGILFTTISNSTTVAIVFISELMGINSSALLVFLLVLGGATFFGILALVFYMFANYYVTLTVPETRPRVEGEKTVEETVSEVVVTSEKGEEEKEEREELLEELEELEFEEFEL